MQGQGLSTFDQLLSFNFTTSDSLQLLALQAEKDYVLKDKGLRVNSSAGSNEFGDLETGNIFRVKAGFEWNILDEGLVDHRITAQILGIKEEIKKIELVEESFINNYSYLYNHIIYCFNKEKLKYLKEKEFLLDIIAKRYEALYHAHVIEYKDLNHILELQTEVEILKLSIQNYNKHFEKISKTSAPELIPHYLPVLQINIDELLAFQYQDSTFEKVNELKKEKNNLEGKLDGQKRLAIYNNVYWRPLQESGSNRYLYSGFGVRFSTGLVSRKKERNRLNELHNMIDVQKNQEDLFIRQKELSNYLLEYHSKLRIYSRFAFQLKELHEDKRLDKAVKLVNYETPQSDLQTLKIDLDRLSIEYELLELKQNLYLLLLKIYKNANVSSILPYVIEKDVKRQHKKLKGDRILLLTGRYSTIQEYNFITEYLLKNEFFNIVIPYNTELNLDFINTLQEADINVYFDINALKYREIIQVPLTDFSSRIEMEYWINDNILNKQNVFFLITDMDEFKALDSVVLEK